MDKHKFLTLDGMRGVAALIILTRHTPIYWGELGFYHSYLAVDFFFMLSGFVLSHAYDKKLLTNEMSFYTFFITRVIRLYPLYFLAALLSAFVSFPFKPFLHGDMDAVYRHFMSLLLGLFYMPSRLYGDMTLFPINGVSWSLFYELVVNIFYALFRSFLSTKRLIFIIAISGIYLCFQSITLNGLDHGHKWGIESISTGAARTIFGFSCGLILHRIFLTKQLIKISNIKGYILFLVISIPMLFSDLKALNGIFDCLIVIVVFPVCVYLGAGVNPKSEMRKTFEMLGIVSYPVYLFHASFAQGLYEFLKLLKFSFKEYIPYSGIVLVAIMFALALLFDRYYDRPVRRYLTLQAIKR